MRVNGVEIPNSARQLRDGGRIIAITYSPSTRYGSRQPWAAMGAAKAALEALVRYFAVALGPRGVTVNCVSPGFVLGQAGMLDETVVNTLPPEAQQAIRDWHEGGWTPMRRLATPAEVGGVVALLCAREAGFITGQTLHVDGGASLMDAFSPLQMQGDSAYKRERACRGASTVRLERRGVKAHPADYWSHAGTDHLGRTLLLPPSPSFKRSRTRLVSEFEKLVQRQQGSGSITARGTQPMSHSIRQVPLP